MTWVCDSKYTDWLKIKGKNVKFTILDKFCSYREKIRNSYSCLSCQFSRTRVFLQIKARSWMVPIKSKGQVLKK